MFKNIRRNNPKMFLAATPLFCVAFVTAIFLYTRYDIWTLDKMNGFWGRKRENGTEKGTRHCFAPNPPLAGGTRRHCVP